MKRFVTYLYRCERGSKTKNLGFIRVNVRGEETTLEVYIRNLSRGSDAGKMYMLICKEHLLGIELGEIKVENGQSDSRFLVQTDNIMRRGFSINNVEGVGIQLDSGEYIASCWRDEYGDEIVRGEFDSEIEMPQNLSQAIVRDGPSTTYEKIELSQIRNLPSPNWHLATNSFLVHGAWNYGYLVFKKVVEENTERLALGVPGIFEKPEAVMAIYFGFPTFEEIPPEAVSADMNSLVSLSEMKTNQEPKAGAFGCWFTRLNI